MFQSTQNITQHTHNTQPTTHKNLRSIGVELMNIDYINTIYNNTMWIFKQLRNNSNEFVWEEHTNAKQKAPNPFPKRERDTFGWTRTRTLTRTCTDMHRLALIGRLIRKLLRKPQQEESEFKAHLLFKNYIIIIANKLLMYNSHTLHFTHTDTYIYI